MSVFLWFYILLSHYIYMHFTHSSTVCVSVVHVHFCVSDLWWIYKGYQFCKYFWDHDTWSWPYFFSFFSTIMGSPPCWACHQLAEPAGCPRTLEQYQADRASICQQPTPNRCTALKPASQYQGLTFEMFSLTHKHTHTYI